MLKILDMIRRMIILSLLLSLNVNAETKRGCVDDPVRKEPKKTLLCDNGTSCSCPGDLYTSYLNQGEYYLSEPIAQNKAVYQCSTSIPYGFKLLNEANKKIQKDVQCLKDPSLTHVNRNEWLLEQVDFLPKNCKYALNVTVSVLDTAYQELLKCPVDKLVSLCTNLDKMCQPSMCTSAAFSAFTVMIRKLIKEGKISSAQADKFLGYKSAAWKSFNILCRPDDFFSSSGLGDGRVMDAKDIAVCSQKNWPSQGDFVQLWRYNAKGERGSGHSVVFDSYLKDKNNTVTGICYWTSNAEQMTNGYGKRCEPISKVMQLISGRITL